MNHNDSVLDLIDTALHDCSVSDDAMRSVPTPRDGAATGAGALLVRPDGTVTDLQLPDSDGDNLTLFYRAIGCDRVDVAALDDGLDMWFDDEMLYTQELSNPYATKLALRYGFTGQLYYGPVVLTGGADRHGDDRPLPPDQAEALRFYFALMRTPF